MAEITVEQLAAEIGTPVEKLLGQFAEAGIKKSQDDVVNQQEKERLLTFLKQHHGDQTDLQPKKMTLSRKKKSTLVLGSGSKAKTFRN